MKINFSDLTTDELQTMSAAGDEVLETLRLLGKADSNTVKRVIEHHGTFYEMDHYPPGDVYDRETGSQYYYHSHRHESGEHGHFHTFIHSEVMPEDIEPYPFSTESERPMGEDAICHLIAVAMDPQGLPIDLFTTNQWVTGETFYKAEDTFNLLDKFEIDHAYPCHVTNRWLSAMLKLFRPQIHRLLQERDERIKQYQKQHPNVDIFADENLEVTSSQNIDIDEQIELIDRELKRRFSNQNVQN